MRFNTFVSSQEDIHTAASIPEIQEILLEPILLARQGTLTQAQVFSFAQEAQDSGLAAVLVWDTLMTENQLAMISDRIQSWKLERFSAIRIADVGVAQWLADHYPQLPIQLSVETGNHNLKGLLSWCELFKNTLRRLVLSIELPEEKLAEYCKVLPVECELLGAGRILLFYSPRELLSPVISSADTPIIDTHIQTDEYGDRAFPTQESMHGTFMYLDKDQFLLDRLSTLEDCGFHTIRIDTRHFSSDQSAQSSLKKLCHTAIHHADQIKELWPFPVRAPFFKANRTTAVFPRLKSKLSPLRDTSCIAQCIGSKNGEYGVFQTLHPFDRSQIKQMILPTKVAIDIPNYVTFHTISGKELGQCDAGQTIVMSWMKRTASGAILVM